MKSELRFEGDEYEIMKADLRSTTMAQSSRSNIMIRLIEARSRR